MANIIRLKRTSVKGKVPTLSNLATAELALNTRDGRLYSANNTHVYEIGSNPHNVVKATFQALINLRSANKIAAVRGISLEKVFNG